MSNDKTAWHFLVNPAARRGKAYGRWQKMLPRLRAALPGMTVVESVAEEGMAALAKATVMNGKTRIVGVGGDGTHHDILNGIVAADGLNEVIYAPLPLGTGNDWVRTLGTPKQLDKWLVMLEREETISHRIGVLKYFTSKGRIRVNPRNPLKSAIQNDAGYNSSSLHGGRAGGGGGKHTEPLRAKVQEDGHRPEGRYYGEGTTHFLNVAGLAYDAEVVRRSEAARYKHRFLYPFLTLLYLKDFDAPTVRIDYGGESFTGPVHTINLGIGRYSGGGMRLVPQAEPTADTLALTYAHRLPVWKILLESWRFYTGTVGRVSGVTTTHAKSVNITLVSGNLELEADGEWLGRGGVEVSLLSDCLHVVV